MVITGYIYHLLDTEELLGILSTYCSWMILTINKHPLLPRTAWTNLSLYWKLCVCCGAGIFKFLNIITHMSGYRMLSPTVIVIRKFETRMNVRYQKLLEK